MVGDAQEIHAFISKPKVAILFLISAAMFAMGFFCVAKADGEIKPLLAGLLLLLIGAGMSIIFLKMLFKTGVWLEIDNRGVLWRSMSEKRIPWSEVKFIDEYQIKQSKQVRVFLKNPDRYISTKGFVAFLRKLEKADYLSITASTVSASHKDILKSAYFYHQKSFSDKRLNEDVFQNLEF